MEWPKLCTTRLLDQNFGMCISPKDILVPFFNNHGTNYYRPWKLCEEFEKKDFGSTVDNSKDNFRITLDVQHFLPNEVSVKVNDKEIIIEGNHEEREDDHGIVSRRFIRRYALPKDCRSETVTSTLSSDGVLTIIANKVTTKEIEGVKIIPIKLEGACRNNGKIETTKIAKEVKSETCCVMKNDKSEMKNDKCEKQKDKCDLKNDNSEMKNDKSQLKNNKCEMRNDKCEIKNDKSEIKNEICEKKNEMSEIKANVEKEKMLSQIMLKEEHSRLLKPELLKEAATESEKLLLETKKDTEKLLSESRKETNELLKLISADQIMTTETTGKLEEALGQCKTAIKDLKKEKLAEASMAATAELSSMKSSMMSQAIEMNMSSSSTSKATTSTSEKICDIITAELQEAAENI